MALWIAFALLTAIVVAVLTRPLTASRTGHVSARDADMAVYRDQVSAIEAEQDRGLIGESEAISARAELARRLIRRAGLDDEPEAATDAAAPRRRRWATGLAIMIPLLAIASYVSLGDPTLPGQPLSARLNVPPGQATVVDLVGRVEAQLRANPDDGRGWEVIAPIYLRMDRFADASNAFAQSLRLNGENVPRLTGLGEAMVMAENGIVSGPARKAFERVLALDPGKVEARFWLALAQEQEGNAAAARTAYAALLAEASPDAPWRQMVAERLAAVGGPAMSVPGSVGAGGSEQSEAQQSRSGPQPGPGPSQDDVAAAAAMSAGDRAAFIANMVDRLAGRLAENPADVEGWLRLVRAYAVLGRTEDARGALDKARQAVADDQDKRARLDALAQELGLGT
ncbi:MAG: c-type cytochrome biogenesis protein CcmI [Hyphomicrobiaceae bacterium]|nr:c-type cytochrome biogenesis protein CcmI [Hyphomicrobiaceae bacterium]